MKPKSKVIIPTDTVYEETPPTPLFDNEATLLARPVQPLTPEAIEASRVSIQKAHRPRFSNTTTLLALVTVAAIFIGVGVGFAIGVYRGRQKPQQVVTTTQPQSAAPSTAVNVAPPQSTQTAPAVEQKTEVAGKVEDNQKQPANAVHEQIVSTRAQQKSEAEKSARVERAPAVQSDETDARDDEDARLKRRRERAERRRERRATEDENIPRQVERASRELNRIREIFEGARP